MHHVLLCADKAGALDVRLANRDAHLAYLRANDAIVAAAGPFLDGEGKMMGSLIVLAVETRAEAEAFASGDPYATAGLFASVEIRPWRWAIKPPAA